jgi:hypothetical protein
MNSGTPIAPRQGARRLLLAAFVSCLFASGADAVVIFGLEDDLKGGRRWDAAFRTFDLAGSPAERSLDGGLRWNIEGGSIQGFRDLLDWQGPVPSPDDFEQAIHDSFSAWLGVDPTTGLAAPFEFVHDPTAPVVSGPAGAEIDLFANPTGQGPGITGGLTFAEFTGGLVTLTSGSAGYPGQVMTGTDIWLNDESSGASRTRWTIPLFKTVLTHEIGHALGLGDTDLDGHRFLDDNYDGTSPAMAAATLNNGFSNLIDVLDPSNSPLAIHNVPNSGLGVEAPGVNILMESGIDLPQTGFLTADDFAGRQFLYPAVGTNIPEPSTLWLAALAVAVMSLGYHGGCRRRKLQEFCPSGANLRDDLIV